jgi:hypothetical protein
MLPLQFRKLKTNAPSSNGLCRKRLIGWMWLKTLTLDSLVNTWQLFSIRSRRSLDHAQLGSLLSVKLPPLAQTLLLVAEGSIASVGAGKLVTRTTRTGSA